jgi:hypothetical protein
MNAEQITYLLAEAIDKDKEYKSWHVSTKHLMTLVEMVIAKEREACAEVCKKHADVYAGLDPSPIAQSAWAACIDNRDTILARGKA